MSSRLLLRFQGNQSIASQAVSLDSRPSFFRHLVSPRNRQSRSTTPGLTYPVENNLRESIRETRVKRYLAFEVLGDNPRSIKSRRYRSSTMAKPRFEVMHGDQDLDVLVGRHSSHSGRTYTRALHYAECVIAWFPEVETRRVGWEFTRMTSHLILAQQSNMFLMPASSLPSRAITDASIVSVRTVH